MAPAYVPRLINAVQCIYFQALQDHPQAKDKIISNILKEPDEIGSTVASGGLICARAAPTGWVWYNNYFHRVMTLQYS